MKRGPRYQEIIAASIKVFARTNYEKATTAMIAREAGVAEGTIYRYFPSKKELFLECTRYVEGLLMERYREIYEDTRDQPIEYLKRVAGSYLDFIRENPEMRKFLAFVLNNSFDDDFLEELRRFLDINVNATEHMIRKGIEKGDFRKKLDPRIAAWMFVGGYFTLILMTEVGAAEGEDPSFLENLLYAVIE